MNKCDFCNGQLADNWETLSKKEILHITSKFPTAGDFAKHYGFPNTILVGMYIRFNKENANSIILCSACADRLPRNTNKPWYQFWK